MSYYIVHVTPDDKFIDMALREFEAVAPGIHKTIILGQEKPLQYIKSKIVNFHSHKSALDLISSKNCKSVIFHSMPDLTLLAGIPTEKKVIWLGWGYDYYDRLLSGAFPEGLHLTSTRKLFKDRPKPNVNLTRLAINKIKSIIKLALGYKNLQNPSLLARVDVFSPVIDVEHKMACALNPWFKASYLTWNYGTLEDDMLTDGNGSNVPLGPHILVGNSATFENNHLEIFDYLSSNFDLKDSNIYCPLSYGEDWYKEQIIKAGKAKFGEKFIALTDFMEKNDYIALLQSCGHVFMNHLRQQALGNICIMMLKGANIYMNPGSPLYNWLRERGAILQAIESPHTASNKEKQALTPLTKAQQLTNTEVIQAHWGRNTQRAKTRHLIDLALGAVIADKS